MIFQGDIMEEKWVDIPHFEDIYQISSLGRVRSKDRVRLQCNNGGWVERLYPGKIIDIDYHSSTTGTVNMYDRGRKAKFAVYVMYSVIFGWLEAEQRYFPNIFTHYDDEVWVDIDRTDGEYQVSNYSQVRRRIGNERIYGGYSYQMMRPFENCGYWSYDLHIKGKSRKFKAHRLAAQAFIPNNDMKPLINHIDGAKKNGHISNFEWCTPKENTEHAVRTGLISQAQVRQAQYSNRMKNAIRIYCPELHKIFLGYKSATKFLGISNTKIKSMMERHTMYKGVTLINADEVN